MKGITRRLFGKTVAASAAAAVSGLTVPELAFGQPRPEAAELRYPKGFLWGCATAAYQIEGGARDDGRGPSTWDVLSHTPGKTHEGDTGDVADDSYHLYKEDVKLLKNLGVATYRMSMSWSRVFPSGKGEVNQKGLDYYSRVVDEVAGQQHHSLRHALSLGYAHRPARRLAVARHPQGFCRLRGLCDQAPRRPRQALDDHQRVRLLYRPGLSRGGQFAPGLKLAAGPANQVRHHGILAHGLAVQAIRANTPAGTQVGLAENANVFVPVMETKEHIEAAHRATRAGQCALPDRA